MLSYFKMKVSLHKGFGSHCLHTMYLLPHFVPYLFMNNASSDYKSKMSC